MKANEISAISAKVLRTESKKDVIFAVTNIFTCVNLINRWAKKNEETNNTNIKEVLSRLGIKHLTINDLPTDRSGALCKYVRKTASTIYYNNEIYTPAGMYIMQRVTHISPASVIDALASYLTMQEAGCNALANTLKAYDHKQAKEAKRNALLAEIEFNYRAGRISAFEAYQKRTKVLAA